MTLAYQAVGSKFGKAEYFSAYLAATAVNTTDPAPGKIIDNRDGRVNAIYAEVVIEDNTAGSAPTLTLELQGSLDGTNFFIVDDSGGTDIKTGALDISGCDNTSTNYVVGFIDTALEGRTSFPPFLRLSANLGGTSSPNWKGNVAAQFIRNAY